MLHWHTAARKAPLVGAFFVCLFCTPCAAADSCSAPETTEQVQVSHVHDGDTLVLRDNRKIRLIGINTPELAQDGRPNEPLAIKARDRLRQLLFQQDNQAQLVYGRQIMDRHSRNMAHLWLPGGENIAAELLREGLGWAIAVPPNITFLGCYLDAEEVARSSSHGVWNEPELSAVNSRKLSLRDRGFRRVKGRIVRVSRGGDSTWINLQGRFAIRIPNKDLKWFSQRPDHSWLGREVEVRGWLYAKRGELRINVRHPASLKLVN